MSASSVIEDVDLVYRCSATARPRSYYINHDRFENFCSSLAGFTRELGENIKDSLWHRFLRPLWRYRFGLYRAPLPFNHCSFDIDNITKELSLCIDQCRWTFPQFQEQAGKLFEQFKMLSSLDDNPLLDAVLAVMQGGGRGRTALVIAERKLIPATEQVLASHEAAQAVSAVSAEQLRDVVYYDLLLVIGDARWFPDYVFSAPRARGVYRISYRWVKGRWRPARALAGVTRLQPGEAGGGLSGPGAEPVEERSGLPGEEELVQYVPEPLLEQAGERLGVSADEAGSHGGVEARLFVLEGGLGVFLEALEGATVLAINPEAGALRPVVRVRVRHIEPGMFILLRTEGGGDYVVPVADQILGEKAGPARAKQHRWKRLLRLAVRIRGADAVIADLRRRGAVRANRTNLRNWLSDRNIKTEDRRDFSAIMSLAGFEKEADDYWRAMEMIERAHQKAGFKIRDQLLEQVRKCDLTQLAKLGRMDFTLPELDGGKLTAFCVKQISGKTFLVAPHRIGEVFEVEKEMAKGQQRGRSLRHGEEGPAGPDSGEP